jgi:hypothetical protein
MISLMESGANRDSITLEYGGERKFPLLLSRCVYGRPESCSRLKNHRQGEMSRMHVQHAAFGGRLLQVFSMSEQEMFTWGQGGGHTACKWVSEEEVGQLPPLSSLWWS